MNEEQWKPVVGYEGIYEVSNHGRVRSLDRLDTRGTKVRGRIMRNCFDKDGYQKVLLCNGTRRRFAVHRLVLEVFVGPCPEGMQACHFPDRNPANCHLDNLRWDTPISNGLDKLAHGTILRGERHGNSKLTESDVLRIFSLRESGKTQCEIADEIGVHRSAIGRILSGQRWAHVVRQAHVYYPGVQ